MIKMLYTRWYNAIYEETCMKQYVALWVVLLATRFIPKFPVFLHLPYWFTNFSYSLSLFIACNKFRLQEIFMQLALESQLKRWWWNFLQVCTKNSWAKEKRFLWHKIKSLVPRSWASLATRLPRSSQGSIFVPTRGTPGVERREGLGISCAVAKGRWRHHWNRVIWILRGKLSLNLGESRHVIFHSPITAMAG